MKKILLSSVVFGVSIYLLCKTCSYDVKAPQFDPEEWWGPMELKERPDNAVKPFKITFDPQMVKYLKERLENHRKATPPLEGVAFEYGFNSKELDKWLKYWAQSYNFSEREKWLNQYPQFKTNIQGLDIHFIRVKPQSTKVKTIPILMLHGFPGSVSEFYGAIPLLTQPRDGYDFAFEVIAPSLPGYGFSDAAVRPGLRSPKVAVIMRNLMKRLGFEKFYIQGGDWGSIIASSLVTLYPDEVLGFHTNLALLMSPSVMLPTITGAFFPSLIVEDHLADRMYPLSSFFSYALEEFGYLHIQATKPDTIGVALTDSPGGLLAYILEKFSSWTHPDNKNLPDGGLEMRYTKDQLLDNLMFYWTTGSITTAMRLYSETFNKKFLEYDLDGFKTPVPTWALQGKYELTYQPPGIIKKKYTNLLDVTVVDVGGHFFALERPQIFADDVFKAVKAFISWNAENGNNKTEL